MKKIRKGEFEMSAQVDRRSFCFGIAGVGLGIPVMSLAGQPLGAAAAERHLSTAAAPGGSLSTIRGIVASNNAGVLKLKGDARSYDARFATVWNHYSRMEPGQLLAGTSVTLLITASTSSRIVVGQVWVA